MIKILNFKKNVSRAVIAFVIFTMVITGFVYIDYAYADTDDDSTAGSSSIIYGIITSSYGAKLRSQPSTEDGSDWITTIDYKKKIQILDTVEGSDGYIWYMTKSEKGTIGYVRGDLVQIERTETYVYDETFEGMLENEGFPESYKELLRDLHAKYPTWNFKAQRTGLDWMEVVNEECRLGTSLVESSSIASWKNTKSPAYNEETGKYKSYDSGGWNAASRKIVKYYLDPRNFLTPIGIFQFFSLDFDETTQTTEGLNKILKTGFMSSDRGYPEDDYETYADVIYAAGKKAGVNPYVLASMILVEQGTDGNGGSISGTQSGYSGLYNFFNIRAYRSGSYSAVQYGLLYAGATDADTLRPWNTRTKSILGGALIFSKNYVQNNKNTLYLKKWNVLNGLDSVGNGQYMTNVQGAESEASQLRKAYSMTLDENYTFYIPVYDNMPEALSTKPTGTKTVLGLDEDEESLGSKDTSKDNASGSQSEGSSTEEQLITEEISPEEEKRAEIAERNSEITEGIEATTIKLNSEKTSKGIKLSWKKSAGYKVDYYEVYRSTSRNSGYGKTAYFIREDISKCWYVNSKALKKGQTYYFKVRGVRLITDYDGNVKKVYTEYSNKSYRTIK